MRARSLSHLLIGPLGYRVIGWAPRYRRCCESWAKRRKKLRKLAIAKWSVLETKSFPTNQLRELACAWRLGTPKMALQNFVLGDVSRRGFYSVISK